LTVIEQTSKTMIF